ncbi:extracellular solute-binding protein [Patescibacteria group bacterium]|nr:extracellular solute-binding protein [Patescibacteria group bacterium]
MIKFKSTRFIVIFFVMTVLISSGFSCRCVSNEMEEKIAPINLVYWRATDSQDAFLEIIKSFRKKYPHISVTYRSLRPEEYEQALLEAWAEDRGPDIFSIPQNWLGKYQTKILPLGLSQEILMAREVVSEGIQKEVKVIEEKKKAPNLRQLKETFVETVPQDILKEGKIYGLPLSLDVLALYYNRDILNEAGIIRPPQNWQEFVDQARILNLWDQEGNFLRSAVPLGTAKNIENYPDILSLLMLQNGTSVVNETGQAIFDQPLPQDPDYFPGEEALRFYLSFANPSQDIYSWNQDMPESLNAFTQGLTGFLFGYSNYLNLIKEQAPKLNFDLTKVPQIKESLKEVNYANYWMETVSKKSQHPEAAWAFLLHAIEPINAKTFVERAKKPTAHRSLIQFQLEDFDLMPFASSVLTAQTWYQGKSYSLVKESFQEMIESVLNGQKTIKEAIKYAAQRINLTN